MSIAIARLIAAVVMGVSLPGVIASDKADEPETAAEYLLKGQKLFAVKKVKEAQAAFEKAAELEPNNPTVKIGQFAILLNMGRPSGALALVGLQSPGCAWG